MKCTKHPDEQLIPVYGWLGGEMITERLICSACEFEKPPKPVRMPMRFVVEP